MRVGQVLAGLFLLSSLAFGAEHTVTQKDKKFDKDSITIKKGDSIKFINADNTPHHLMMKADGKRVSEKQPNGGPPVIQKFANAQTTTVRCAIHPKMKLKVTVE